MIKRGSALICASFILWSGLGCAFWTPRAAGQAARERPKLKDFGNSLDRLKWDEKTRASVETKARNWKEQKPGSQDEEEEVVRVETSLVVCDVLVPDPQGHAVRGLTRDDYVVSEDGRAQEVGTSSLGDDVNVPRPIVLGRDYSGSQLPSLR